jgi:hypothetical protein
MSSFVLGVTFLQVDPQFAAAGLTDNGGPTRTITLQPTSPAINGGSNAAAAALNSDQRGFIPRVVNGTVDIGAVEVGATPPGGRPANQNAVSQYGTSGDAGGAAVRNADGTVLATDAGPGGAGTRIAVADFTADGVPDSVLATGPGVRVTVTVVDGADGQVVRSFPVFEDTFTGGAFVAAGDVTGDGVPDIAVSADNTGGARVLVFDGTTGAVLADFFGIDDPSFRGGARVAFGDVNADGLSDLIVAAGTGGGPRVAVFDGRSLRPGVTPTRLVNDFFAFEQTLRDGLFVTAGDVNGDGIADLVFGGGPGGGPRVLIWDSLPFFLSGGTDVRPLADFFAADPALSAGVRVAAKDLDGDAFSDLVVGVPLGAGSVVKTYLGQSFTPTGTPPAATEIDPGVGGVFVG